MTLKSFLCILCLSFALSAQEDKKNSATNEKEVKKVSKTQSFDDESLLVLKSIRERYKKLGNWSAEFLQSEESIALGPGSSNKGTLIYAEKDRFRFSLSGAENIDFYSNGKKAWFLDFKNSRKNKKPEVKKFSDIQKIDLSRYLIFFRGLKDAGSNFEKLEKDFNIKGRYQEKMQSLELILKPKHSSEIAQMTLFFNNESEAPQKAVIEDLVGSKTTLKIIKHKKLKTVSSKHFAPPRKFL